MRRMLWLGLALAVTAALVAALIYRTRRVKAATDAVKIEKDIRDHLPLGASRAKVVAYLDERGIQHSYIDESKQAPEYRHTEMAMVRGASRTWLIRGDVQILFKFDESGNLANYSVREIFTGP